MADADLTGNAPDWIVPFPVGQSGDRPRLRLVEGRGSDLWPISPELALIDPSLARAARAALTEQPCAGLPTENQAAFPSAYGRGGAETAAPVEEEHRTMSEVFASQRRDIPGLRRLPFDTPDRRLRRLGLTLERRVRTGSPSWKLVLSRGEVVTTKGAPGSDEPPAEIRQLLRVVVGAEPLRPVPWHSDDPDFARLQVHVSKQRDEMLRHEPGIRLGEDPENLHQFRVANRRLRASLRMGRKLVDRGWADSLHNALAELGRASGPARDLDVLLERLTHELETVPPADRPAGAALLAELRSQRSAQQDELLRVLDAPGCRQLRHELDSPIRPRNRPAKRRLSQLAGRELHELVERVRELGQAPRSSELHRLRIRVKRVRYALELTGGPTRGHAVRLIEAAAALQGLLGGHHDSVLAEEQLRRIGRASRDGAVSFVAGSLAERERRLGDRIERQLPSAWKQLRRATRKRPY